MSSVFTASEIALARLALMSGPGTDLDVVVGGLGLGYTAGAAGLASVGREQDGAVRAEALSGLARAFFYAGSRALLVSHWAVDSDATVGLINSAMLDHLS